MISPGFKYSGTTSFSKNFLFLNSIGLLDASTELKNDTKNNMKIPIAIIVFLFIIYIPLKIKLIICVILKYNLNVIY